MPLRSIVLTAVCVLMIAVGQLLFKAAADQWNPEGFTWSTLARFLSPVMILALAVYGVATLLWVYVLRTVPLSSAYAIFALAFLIVPVLAHFVLGEKLEANTLIGGAIIVVGIVVAVR